MSALPIVAKARVMEDAISLTGRTGKPRPSRRAFQALLRMRFSENFALCTSNKVAVALILRAREARVSKDEGGTGQMNTTREVKR